MVELLTADHDRELVPGDVLMVERKMRDKVTRKNWTWKFFLVVTRAEVWSDEVAGYVVGNERLKGKEFRIYVGHDRETVHYLPIDEWPDGVHALRMQMVLGGQIEGIV